MSIIGNFTKTDTGFTGSIKTLRLNVKARIVAQEAAGESAPDYRLYVNGYEAGAGWSQTSEGGRDYVSFKFDDPTFPAPINAGLFKDKEKDGYFLIWSRRDPD
ncbi:DUF736 domain-containing protein [Asticcacaulis benevestitus]|uniref:DUF736 domain-containing protein n=1 Tax=Asticcacaulis benevestitus DSM 16100 = ATCC BAA-896 TaxID=1121022 RepID=V4PEY8_9CAUL|nr:DUF736 domain-containing protein [Asticcacaulis benevestitus]ESQ92522.1 hypothetical protein ABENE_07755 [Asticcacaulis benevestitus DSM 16100 = ATCC BAA-896]